MPFRQARDGRIIPIENVFAGYSWAVQHVYRPYVRLSRILCSTEHNPSCDELGLAFSADSGRCCVVFMSPTPGCGIPLFRQTDAILDVIGPSRTEYLCQFRPPDFVSVHDGVRSARWFPISGFPTLTNFWERIEVPRGCHVLLPPAFIYDAEELQDAESGWWVVAYTELVSRTMAFVLLDAYDSLWLWALSPDTFPLARDLNLDPVLGLMKNLTEVMLILDVVSNTRLDTLPIRWGNRG